MNPFQELQTFFREDKFRNALIARQEDLRRPEQPYLSRPGLKRFCENHIRFRKIIIETEEDVLQAKMWFRGNHEIPFSEIVKVKRKEPICQSEGPKLSESGNESPKPSPEKTQASVSTETLRLPPQASKEPERKRSASGQDRREWMKKYWERRKARDAMQRKGKEKETKT